MTSLGVARPARLHVQQPPPGPMLSNVISASDIDWWWRLPFWFRGVGYAAVTLVVIGFGGVTQKFIYFDF